MKTSLRIIVAILFVILHVFSFGQCPENTNVFKTAASNDSTKCHNLALLLKNCPEKQDSVAYLYYTLGKICYRSTNRTEAIRFTKKALKIQRQFLEPNDTLIGMSCHNLGVYNKKEQDYGEAEIYFKQAIEVYHGVHSTRELKSLIELGSVYNWIGDYDRSIQAFDSAIPIAKGLKDSSQIIKCYLQYGFVLHNKEFYQAAIDSLKLGLSYYNSTLAPSLDVVYNYLNLARSFYTIEDYNNSIQYGRLAIKWLESYKKFYYLGVVLNNLGLAYLKTGDIEKAEIYFKKAQKIGKERKISSLVAQSHNNLGEVYKIKGMKEQALQSFQNAIILTVDGYYNSDYLNNPSKEDIKKVSAKTDLLGYLSDKANYLLEVYRESGDNKLLEKSLETFKFCDFTIDRLRSEHIDQNSKLFWREKVIPIYEKAIFASHLAEDYESAFLFFEKSKAVLLLDAMLNAEAMVNIQNDSLIAVEKALRKKLVNARESLESAKEQEKKAALSNLRQVNNEFDEFTKMLSDTYPNYHKTKFDTEVVSLSKLSNQQFQNGNTALIHYFLGKEKTWMLALSKREPVFKALGTAEKTDELVKRYLSFFDNRDAIINAPDDFGAAAWDLYQYLVAPADLSGIKELIIVPDGILGFLPFGALVTEKPGEDGFYGLKYLIKDHNIRFSFSATILDRQNNFSETNKQLIGFAPFASDQFKGEYAPLPDSDNELSYIENLVVGKYFKNELATKHRFLNNIGINSVIHLSTHATANTAKGQPYIVFADSLLNLSELYSLTIPADLVVLSACETNNGEVKKGEGIFGLSRGFAYAGANSIIASLWSVNSHSTGKIFPMFYEGLQNEKSKSIALQEAKLKFIEASKQQGRIVTPYDWAGFVVIGNDENIDLEKPVNTGKVLLIVLAAGLFLIPVLRRRKWK